MVMKIVEAHHGRVEVLENPGGGTVFRVISPFANRTPSPREEDADCWQNDVEQLETGRVSKR